MMKKLIIKLFTLVLIFTFSLQFSALHAEYIEGEWRGLTDAREIKEKNKDIQKYMPPLNNNKDYFYTIYWSGMGNNYFSNSKDSYNPNVKYIAEIDKLNDSDNTWERSSKVVQVLKLPDMPGYDEDFNYVYSVKPYSNSTKFEEINGEDTTIWGLPAKVRELEGEIREGRVGKREGYNYHAYINLTNIAFYFPVGTENVQFPERLIIEFEVHNKNFGTEAVAICKNIKNQFVNGTISVSEPIVVAANTVAKADENKKGGLVDLFKDTDASKEVGEDEGTDIPEAILGGILVGVAGLAVTAGAFGESDDSGSSDDDKKKKNLKMYLNKEFGDSLKKGAPSQVVYARIAEIDENGNEIDRPDLSKHIRIYTEDAALTVKENGMAGNYKAAEVCVPLEDEKESEGRVFFTYKDKGGSFTNRVKFRLLGKPYISFPEKPENDMTFIQPMLFGDEGPYEVLFNLNNFEEIPDKIEVSSKNTKLELKYEKLTDVNYKLIIINHEEERKDSFESEKYYVSLKAETKKELAEDSFTIEMYPEGLAVLSKLEDKKLVVHTEKEDVTYGDGSIHELIMSTELKLLITIKEAPGKIKVLTDGFSIEKFKTDDKVTGIMLDHFDYEIKDDRAKEGIFYITPKTSIGEPSYQQYLAELKIKNANDPEHREFILPSRITGDVIDLGAPEDRKKEIELLKRTIQRYGINGDSSVRAMIKTIEFQPVSMIKQMRQILLLEAIEYYTKDAEFWNGYADKIDNVLTACEVMKFFGDQAFSYVIKATMGEVAEMLLTPMKDVLVEIGGNAFRDYNWGTKPENGYFNYEALMKVLDGMAENYLLSVLTDFSADNITNAVKGKSITKLFEMEADAADPKAKLKKAARFLVMFAMLNYAKHYCLDEDTKDDVGKSLVATFNDCTTNMIKTIIAKYLEKWLGTKKITVTEGEGMSVATNMERFVNRFISSWLKMADLKAFGKQIAKDDAPTMVLQFVDGLSGVATDQISSIWDGSGKFFVWAFNGLYEITFSGFMDWFFEKIDNLFGLSSVAVKEEVPVPAFIPPSSREDVKKANEKLDSNR